MARLTVLLIGLRTGSAGSSRPGLHVLELENRHLVDVDDVNDAGLLIGARRTPVRSALIAGHRDRVNQRGRRVHPLVARLRHALAHPGVLFRREQPRVDVVGCERLPRKRRRSGREGLGRPGFFTGHVALRHRPLFNRPQRFTRHAIEDVQEAGLAGVSHCVDTVAVVLHRHQLGRRHVVQVPQIVMDGLEMPQALAGACVEREQTVGEKVGAVPIRAVEVVGRRSGWDIDDATFIVDGHLTPVVRAAGVLECIFRPRLVAELTGLRHRVKLPRALAGDDVVGADVAGWRHPSLAGRRSHNQQVLPHFAGAPRLHAAVRAFSAPQALSHVDDPVGAEAPDRLAALRVNGLQIAVDGKDQPLVFSVRALPVVEAATGHAGQAFVDPDFLARRRVERDERVVAPRHVHDIIDDDRVEARCGIWIEPGHFEPAHIGFLDLIEVGEMRSAGPTAEVPPPLVALPVCHDDGDKADEYGGGDAWQCGTRCPFHVCFRSGI